MGVGRERTLAVEVRIAEEILSAVGFNNRHFPDELPLAVGLLLEVNDHPCIVEGIRPRAHGEREQVISAETDIQCTHRVGRRE